MKRIIDGKRYDTDTATHLARWNNGIYGNDFRSCEESLYKTKNGSYFIVGQGGAMSKYAEPAGNNSVGGGSALEPVTPDEAFEWLCTHGQADVAEVEFSDMVQDA